MPKKFDPQKNTTRLPALTRDPFNRVLNETPNYAKPGTCACCGEALTGRRTKYCSDECAWDWSGRFVQVHWLRRHIFARDDYTCLNCDYEGKATFRRGAVLQPAPWVLQLHHIVPLSNGGDHSDENLATLCEDCHKLAHGKR